MINNSKIAGTGFVVFLCAVISAFGQLPPQDVYNAAIQAAQERFDKSLESAKARLIEDIKAAQKLREATSAPVSESEYPVEVAGGDPKPLMELAGAKGWSEVPEFAHTAVIFETLEDQPADGVVEFRVLRDGPVWLAASWAYDGNPSGGWQAERKSKQQLVDAGWKVLGEMYYKNVDRHTILARDCKAGDTFSIRSRKYRRPFVLIPNVVKDPKVESSTKVDPSVVIEVAGSTASPVSELMPEKSVPEELKGSEGFVPPNAGVTVIQVHRRCLLYLAASWEYDGNASGQWQEERWSRERLEERGWKEIRNITVRHRGTDQPHVLFVRECDKGERFRIRTRKYGAPVVFLPPMS